MLLSNIPAPSLWLLKRSPCVQERGRELLRLRGFFRFRECVWPLGHTDSLGKGRKREMLQKREKCARGKKEIRRNVRKQLKERKWNITLLTSGKKKNASQRKEHRWVNMLQTRVIIHWNSSALYPFKNVDKERTPRTSDFIWKRTTCTNAEIRRLSTSNQQPTISACVAFCNVCPQQLSCDRRPPGAAASVGGPRSQIPRGCSAPPPSPPRPRASPAQHGISWLPPTDGSRNLGCCWMNLELLALHKSSWDCHDEELQSGASWPHFHFGFKLKRCIFLIDDCRIFTSSSMCELEVTSTQTLSYFFRSQWLLWQMLHPYVFNSI